jgi:hypothetical protein
MLDDRPLGVLHMSCTGTPVDVRVELRLHRSVCLARQRSLVCHEFGFMALLRVSDLRVQQLIGTMTHQPGALATIADADAVIVGVASPEAVPFFPEINLGMRFFCCGNAHYCLFFS